MTRIAAERGRVVGVELENGERLSGRIVIADVTPHALLALAGDALNGRYAEALRRFRYGPSTLKLDWALSEPVPWTAPEAREAGTVHVGGTEQEMLDALAPTGRRLPERPLLLFGQQSIADPTRAPAGQHTAWAYTHGPQEADWEAETERHVERVEAQIERFAPGFRDLILARHVQSPAELQRRNPNLVAGDVGAGSYTLDQVIFRPLPSLSSLSHAGARPVPRQLRDVPGRRRSRRARTGRGPRGAARGARPARVAPAAATGGAGRAVSPRRRGGRPAAASVCGRVPGARG